MRKILPLIVATVVRGIRARGGAFALAVIALLVIAAGLATEVRMLSLPAMVPSSCTESGSGTICYYSANPAIQLWLGPLIAVVGIGLLVVAWSFDRRPYERPRQGWKALFAWGAPLVWLALVPIAAVPITVVLAGQAVNERTCQIYVFIGATADCPVSVLIPSVLIPGLLNLVPLRWLWTADSRTRIAAIAASILGIAGLLVSVGSLLAQGPVVTIDFGIFGPPYPPSTLFGLGFGIVVWLATLIGLLAVAKLPFAGRSHP